MQSNKKSGPWLFVCIAGHLLFAVLFFLAWIFWKERQAFDTAHYLFELINNKSFFVAHGRPIAVVSQILPLIGIWFHVSLEWVMRSFSIGDVLFYYLIFLFLIYTLKDAAGAFALLLTVSITVNYTFYCPVSELIQALALLVLFNSLLYRSFRFRMALLIPLMFLLVFSHPLMFIPLAAVIGQWSLEKPGIKALLYCWIAFVLITVLKLLNLDIYDHQKTFYAMVFNDYSHLHNIKDVSFIFSFLTLLLREYYALFSLAGITIFLLFLTSNIKQLVFFLLCILGFLAVIIETHHFTEITNYSERMLLPLTSIIVIPFTMFLFRSKSAAGIFGVLFLCCFFLFLRVQIIYATALPYTLRVGQMQQLIHQSHQFHQQKTIAEDAVLEQVPFAFTGWCYSIETTLFSALAGPDSCVSISLQQEHIQRIKNQGKSVLPNQWIKWTEILMDQSGFNKDYLRFTASEYSPLLNEINDTIYQFPQIKLSFILPLIPYNENMRLLSVIISSSSKERIYSKSLRIIEEIIPDDNSDMAIRNEVSLESDFIGSYKQMIPVYFPEKYTSLRINITLVNDRQHTQLAKESVLINRVVH